MINNCWSSNDYRCESKLDFYGFMFAICWQIKLNIKIIFDISWSSWLKVLKKKNFYINSWLYRCVGYWKSISTVSRYYTVWFKNCVHLKYVRKRQWAKYCYIVLGEWWATDALDEICINHPLLLLYLSTMPHKPWPNVYCTDSIAILVLLCWLSLTYQAKE